MNTAVQMPWRNLAWNGIQFSAPADWEVAKLAARYLMLEDDSGPRLELKWEPIQGRFSHQTHLRRLAASAKRPARISIQETSLPADWENALSDFKTVAFDWQTATDQGIGAILYCPVCRNAVLIRFYQDHSNQCKPLRRHLLTSLKDHPRDDAVIWAIYDIRAILPKEFKLIHHRFNSGEYTLTFGLKRHRIVLYRWSPASVLLAGRGLSLFATLAAHPPEVSPLTLSKSGMKGLEWETPWPSQLWRQWWLRFKPKPAWHRLRLWHLEQSNRILGVGAECAAPLASHLFERICAGYEST